MRYDDGTDYVEIDLSPRKTLLIVQQGPAAPRAEVLTSEEYRSMGGVPKTPKDALLDPEERLDLLLGHLRNRREGLSEREAACRLKQHGPNEIRRRQDTYL